MNDASSMPPASRPWQGVSRTASRLGLRSIGLHSMLFLGLTGAAAVSAQGFGGAALTWEDACSIPTTDLESWRVLDATVALVHGSQLTLNPGGTTYSLTTGELTELENAIMDDSSLFHGDTTLAPSEQFRSAFLVGRRQLVTAPHHDFTIGNPVSNPIYAVFGLNRLPGTCKHPVYTSIPASQVRKISSIKHDGYVLTDTNLVLSDYMVLELDSPADPAYPFIRLRREGLARVGDAATIAGHPLRIAKRMDTAGYVDSLVNGRPLFRRLHATGGSSGSPVYNLDAQFVETLVATGATCAVVTQISPTHKTLSSSCPVAPFPVNALNTAVEIAAYVDPTELLVSPLESKNVSTSAGTFANPTTLITLQAPAHTDASASIAYQIEAPAAAPAGEPYLQLAPGTSLTGTLSAGSTLSFGVTAIKPPGSTACQSYERSLRVHDLTHGFSDVVRQTIEIGLTGFEVDAGETPIRFEGIQTPYLAERTLQLHNPHPTAVTLFLTATANWLSIDGHEASGAGDLPETTITLAPGATASMPIGISSLAGLLVADGTAYDAAVSIENTDASCGVSPLTSLPVTFTPGRLTRTQIIDAPVSDAPLVGAPSPLGGIIHVPEDFCIDDVRVTYSMRKGSGGAVFVPANWIQESRWQLYRPYSLTPVPLWELNTASGHLGTGPCLEPYADPSLCPTLQVGTDALPPPVTCATSPDPLVCEELDDLIGLGARGNWSTRLSDRVPGGSLAQPHVFRWTLTFFGHPGCSSP